MRLSATRRPEISSEEFPIRERGGLAEVGALVVEEVEDGGAEDAEAAASLADADAGVIVDEAPAPHFVEQEAAFVTVDGFRAGAGGEADDVGPGCLEEIDGGLVEVAEVVVGAKAAEGGEDGRGCLEEGFCRRAQRVVELDEVATKKAAEIAEDEAAGRGEVGVRKRHGSGFFCLDAEEDECGGDPMAGGVHAVVVAEGAAEGADAEAAGDDGPGVVDVAEHGGGVGMAAGVGARAAAQGVPTCAAEEIEPFGFIPPSEGGGIRAGLEKFAEGPADEPAG